MESGEGLSPTDYLDRAFEVIREEARDNPAFAARLVKALGGEVVFPNSAKREVLNPVAVAAAETEAAMRDIYASLSAVELRGVLRDFNLASSVDVRGLDGPGLLDMLVRRARAKAGERMSVRPAAR